MMKVKDACMLPVVFNPAVSALAAFQFDQLDLSFPVIMLFVHHAFRSVAMVPLALILCRVIILSAIVLVLQRLTCAGYGSSLANPSCGHVFLIQHRKE